MITQLEGELRFLVSSDATTEQYLVDLEAHGLNGECTCLNFQIVRKKSLLRKEPGLHRCKHITRAKLWHHTELLKRIIRQRDGKGAFKKDWQKTYGEER